MGDEPAREDPGAGVDDPGVAQDLAGVLSDRVRSAALQLPRDRVLPVVYIVDPFPNQAPQ